MKLKDFNPTRLKSARLYRGKVIDVLAKETGINKKDILAFEESKYLPTLENAKKLSSKLDFPLEYFFKKDNIKVIVENTHFAVPGCILRVEEIALREKLIMTNKLLKGINLPKLNLPKIKNTDIEKLANEVRNHFGVSLEIKNLQDILEDNGIVISSINKGRKGSSASTQKQIMDGEVRYFICLGDDEDNLYKRNFDLAYELGYIVGNYLNIPTKSFSKDEFACAFLIPKESFINDLENPTDLNSYIKLKNKYNVETIILLFRANMLNLINYKEYNNLLRKVKEEKDIVKVSSPKLLKSCFDKISSDIDLNKEDLKILFDGYKS